jgi:hypothetical protein
MKQALSEEGTKEALKEINHVIPLTQIPCWLDQGALLGAIREGKLISYDFDVDIGFFVKDGLKLLQKVPTFKKLGYKVCVHCNNIYLDKTNTSICFMGYQPLGECYYHIDYASFTSLSARAQIAYDVATHRELQTLNGRFANMTHSAAFNRFNKILLEKASYTLWKIFGGETFSQLTPKHYYDNLDQIKFYGIQIKIPSNIENYLAFRYGENWRIPDPKWNWRNGGGIVSAPKHKWVMLHNLRMCS